MSVPPLIRSWRASSNWTPPSPSRTVAQASQGSCNALLPVALHHALNGIYFKRSATSLAGATSSRYRTSCSTSNARPGWTPSFRGPAFVLAARASQAQGYGSLSRLRFPIDIHSIDAASTPRSPAITRKFTEYPAGPLSPHRCLDVHQTIASDFSGAS